MNKSTENNIAFPGFPSDIFLFLKELSENNNKAWFLEQKPRYETSVREPSKHFIHTIADCFSRSALPYSADEKTSLFRIHRDTRFSKNKSPYKTNIGFVFPFNAKGKSNAISSSGVYVHIEPGNCAIGGGIYMPESKTLLNIRRNISERFDEWQNIVNNSIFAKEFPGGVVGESLKTFPRGFSPDHPASSYLKMKQFYIWQPINDFQVLSQDFLEIVEIKSVAMLEFSEFLHQSTNNE